MNMLRLASTLCLITLMASIVSPSVAIAKVKSASQKANAAAASNPTVAAYVNNVFEKLQYHWEAQAFANQMNDATLTFLLNEDGSLQSSGLDQGANTEAGRALLSYLKQQAPFGRFPVDVTGTQLEFKFKLSPDSLQMVSYQLLPPSAQNSVLAFASPVPNQPQPVSLFYTRVGSAGRVWENPSKNAAAAQAMDSYLAQVQAQIKASWALPQDYVFQRTIATLMIDRDGTLLSATIKESSGDAMVDKAALDAIYRAGQFPTAPANIPSLPVTIEHIFEPFLTDAE